MSNRINSINKKIIYLLTRYKVKPSKIIELYNKNDHNLAKTINLLLKNPNLTLNSKENLKNFSGIGKCENTEDMSKLNGGNNKEYLEILNYLSRSNINILNISDCNYPYLLKEIYFPPPLIFYKGNKIIESKINIAVVGTRKCSSYGKEVAEYIGYQLSKLGITVVSGLALGIDTYAHKGAIKEKGGSIGIMGCGIDIIYPPENSYLYKNIIGNGSIISEFLPGTPPLKGNFPARNRLISGVCQGVVVVEAGIRSGALITSELALKQNREVFAVPGNIFSLKSKGTHMLIKSGAKLVEDIDDILEELQNYLGGLKRTEKKCNQDNSIKNRKKYFIKLSDNEQKVYNCIKFRATSFEEIASKTGLNINELLKILTVLQINNLVEEVSLNKYKKCY